MAGHDRNEWNPISSADISLFIWLVLARLSLGETLIWYRTPRCPWIEIIVPHSSTFPQARLKSSNWLPRRLRDCCGFSIACNVETVFRAGSRQLVKKLRQLQFEWLESDEAVHARALCPLDLCITLIRPQSIRFKTSRRKSCKVVAPSPYSISLRNDDRIGSELTERHGHRGPASRHWSATPHQIWDNQSMHACWADETCDT